MTYDRITPLQPPTTDVLFGLSFDTTGRAQQFMLALRDLARDRKLRLMDTVLVIKDDRGRARVRETIDLQPGRSALVGAMWTSLLGLVIAGPLGWLAGALVGAAAGAAAAKIIDRGVPDDWVNWFEEAVEPRTANVVVLAGDVDQQALRAEVGRFPGARLVHTTVPNAAFDGLPTVTTDAGRADDVHAR